MAGLRIDADGIPELDEFNLQWIMLDATVVNFGKRRTGKSTLTKHMLYTYFQEFFPRGIVISQTDDLNKTYQAFVPKKFIHPELKNDVQQSLLNFQRALRKDPQHEKRKQEDDDYNRAFIIYDDVIQDENAIRYSQPLRTIFVNGRHFEILAILNTQYVTAIPPTMRDNVDVAFMFSATNHGTKEHLYQCFGDMLPRQFFFALLDKYTCDFGTLVYYNQDANQKAINKKFFWYKADPNTPDFAMGTPAFWGKEAQMGDDQAFNKFLATGD